MMNVKLKAWCNGELKEVMLSEYRDKNGKFVSTSYDLPIRGIATLNGQKRGIFVDQDESGKLYIVPHMMVSEKA